ncbi:aminoglycoside phosphotransferase family protein [Plantactinospora siamensis]|uniref:Aminoglycoside phosphotransferase family protein n=1 Tax=Plantactinospora siamensis TaxID=555372 RepID=A0ABV6NQ76_9ACTN
MLTDHDRRLLSRAIAAVGLGDAEPVRRLNAADARSGVFLLRRGGRELVVKATADPIGLAGARLEAEVLTRWADDLGVAVPVVEAVAVRGDLVVMVLPAYRPCTADDRQSEREWCDLAVDLGALHRDGPALRAGLVARPWPAAQRISAGLRRWRDLEPELPLDGAAALLADAARPPSRLPTVLIHGDCHLGNVLTDAAGRRLWIDWQDVRLGSGVEDLALLWQRAEFDGARPPRDAMLVAYETARGRSAGPDLRRALAIEELRLLVADWPDFLPGVPAARRAPLVRSFRQAVLTCAGIDVTHAGQGPAGSV